MGNTNETRSPEKGQCGGGFFFSFGSDDPLGVHRDDYTHSPARRRTARRRSRTSRNKSVLHRGNLSKLGKHMGFTYRHFELTNTVLKWSHSAHKITNVAVCGGDVGVIEEDVCLQLTRIIGVCSCHEYGDSERTFTIFADRPFQLVHFRAETEESALRWIQEISSAVQAQQFKKRSSSSKLLTYDSIISSTDDDSKLPGPPTVRSRFGTFTQLKKRIERGHEFWSDVIGRHLNSTRPRSFPLPGGRRRRDKKNNYSHCVLKALRLTACDRVSRWKHVASQTRARGLEMCSSSIESMLRRTRRVRLIVFARFVRYCTDTHSKIPKKRISSMSSYRGIKMSSRKSILKQKKVPDDTCDITEETTST